MSAGANVYTVEALDDARSAFNRYQKAASDILGAARADIDATLAWLIERCLFWQAEVDHRSRELYAAEQQLAYCYTTGTYDSEGHYYPPNCSAEETARSIAEDRLQEATEKRALAMAWRNAMDECNNAYRPEELRMRDLLDQHLTMGLHFLHEAAVQINTYAGMNAGPAVLQQQPDLRATSQRPASATVHQEAEVKPEVERSPERLEGGPAERRLG
jgi:hypothetical protein